MQYILSNSDHGAINSEEKLEAGDFTDEVHTVYSISPEELLNVDECKKKYLEGRGAMHAKQLLLAILDFMSTVNGAIYKGHIVDSALFISLINLPIIYARLLLISYSIN